MNQADIAAAATSLADAEAARRPIEPLSDRYPRIGLADAYAIQLFNAERRIAASERLLGHKVGLTALAMQQKFGVDEPDYGHLFDSMLIPDGGTVHLDRLISPQVEVEPAFLLDRDLEGPGVTADDVVAATGQVVASLEIIDSRVVDWSIKLEDTVADNGSSAAVVLGSEPRALEAESLADAGVELAMDGTVVEVGNTREILGHPVVAVAWLANALAGFGVSMKAGQVVLPGTCTRSTTLRPGSVAGTIQGLGSVSVTVA